MQKKATVHLVSLGDFSISDYDNKLSLIDGLNALYPGIKYELKRGDIIENTDESGYRSQGVYMFNGESIIEQNREWDDYGSPSTEFEIITEFPGDYWDQTYYSGNIKRLPIKSWNGKTKSEFYWHSDPPLAINVDKLQIKYAIKTAVKNNACGWVVNVNYNDKLYKLDIYDIECFLKTIYQDNIIPVRWMNGRIVAFDKC